MKREEMCFSVGGCILLHCQETLLFYSGVDKACGRGWKGSVHLPRVFAVKKGDLRNDGDPSQNCFGALDLGLLRLQHCETSFLFLHGMLPV